MQKYSEDANINVGVGHDVTIRELVELVREVVGYEGALEFDTSKPDGTPRKMLDIGRLQALGWKPKVALHDGLADTYRWFVDNQDSLRAD